MWVWTVGWEAANLFGKHFGDSVDHADHPKHQIVRDETEAAVRLRLTADKPDEGCGIDFELGSKLAVLLRVNLSEPDGRVDAKSCDCRRSFSKLGS